ncbi:hypothetical protein Ngar_c00160 [Candidatus Nitrososphaera gargensis Ga9.2]|uniref:Uncharacterized protein n=1 Tax=Nitrososphaera gargensis (strain Ga9.2) TaxID=1237085 RepID=K0I6T5_NITGG|nr:hypothetical protein Ngar_c00160 [Candidatus Nitrososphaera gargensis Ga9.2]
MSARKFLKLIRYMLLPGGSAKISTRLLAGQEEFSKFWGFLASWDTKGLSLIRYLSCIIVIENHAALIHDLCHRYA